MTEGASAALYLLGLTTALASARSADHGARVRKGRPVATTAALLIIGLPTVAQLTVAPWLLQDLRRDWAAIGTGQFWRLATALVVQDGGIAGTVFNLAFLAVIGAAAEEVWGWRRWAVIALGAGLGAQLWGRVVQPVGAGNSVVVFGLAASLAVLALRSGGRKARLLAVISLLTSVALLGTGDLHGGAAAIGAALGVVLGRHRPNVEVVR